MITDNWLNELTGVLDTLLADFVLGFAFFTSLAYSVFAKRFDRQRPAITVSAVTGFSLSTGLVVWERANNLSIKDLGPVAAGFAVLVIAFVMYKSVKQIGGFWAGAGITIGACILIAALLGFKAAVDPQVIQSITAAAIIIGLIAFLIHTDKRPYSLSKVDSTVYREKPDMARLFRQRHLSDDLNRKMDNLRRETISLSEHPKQAEDIGLQLKRMLPEQGYLTERMAELRSKAHRIRNGHIGRLEETKKAFKRQPTNVKKKASLELIKSYKQLAGMDNRLQRLDNAVAQTEIRIKKLTEKARKYLAENQHKKLYECIKQAEKLQKHNSRLFNIIERTENKLSKLAKNTALQVKQNGK